MESESLLGPTATPLRKGLLIAFVVVFLLVIGLSIAALVLSTKALHSSQNTESATEKCNYSPSDNGNIDPILIESSSSEEPSATLIRNATVWIGNGTTLTGYDVLLQNGQIAGIFPSPYTPPGGNSTVIYNVLGAFVTPGIIDMHSHVGLDNFPVDAVANVDVNEMTDPVTPSMRVIDAFDPEDPAIALIRSGGVTASLVLPGSANLIGGQAFYIKMKGVSVDNMAIKNPPRAVKMAAGENPKRVYGSRGQLPMTRMGNIWGMRKMFASAAALRTQQDQWDCAAGITSQSTPRPYDAELEPMVAILRGDVHLNIHCYQVQDFSSILRVADEFGIHVAAFHHALEAYKMPKAFASRNITIATFSDLWGFKMEAYDASVHAPAILEANNVSTALKSDHPVTYAKYLLHEAQKAYHYGFSAEAALKSITSVPANAIGLGDRIGTIEVGKDADVVVWDRHPLVLGATPLQIYIDGELYANNLVATPPSTALPTTYNMTVPTPCNKNTSSQYAITGATIYTMTGVNPIINGVILVVNGIISCMGPNPQCPHPNYDEYNVNGAWLIPGIVSADSNVGLIEVEQEDDAQDGMVITDDASTIRSADGIKLGTKHVRAAFTGGVTVQIAIPQGPALVAGVSSAFYTQGTITNDALISSYLALHINIGNSAKWTLNTGSVSGQFAQLRAIFNGANSSVPGTPVYDAVVAKTLPIVFRVDQADEIGAVIRLCQQYALTKVTILGGAESVVIPQYLNTTGFNVILSPLRNPPMTFDTLRASVSTPSILANSGTKVGIAVTDPAWVRNLRWEAGWGQQEGGLSLTQALASVTINVAQAFGLPNGIGSIALNTKANFAVYDGNPLEIGSHQVLVAIGNYVECYPYQQ